jgi:nucleotide-binding universal stress UspA family protein
MKRILVPCDFSKSAVNAFNLAVELAKKSSGEVHLLHVIELPVLHDTVLMPVLSFEQAMMDEMKEKTLKEMDKLTSEHKESGLRFTCELAFGPTAPKILNYVDAKKIDLIMMGSHGAHGFREFVIGSNAQKIVRRAAVPVLVVKKGDTGAIDQIVFPNTLETDGQADLVPKVKAMQEFFGATLHIVYINTRLHFTADNITYSRLEDFAKHFKLKNYTLNVFNHPDEEEGIRLFAMKMKADMIAIGTHGRRGLAHLIAGSLAEDITNHEGKLIWTYSLKTDEE